MKSGNLPRIGIVLLVLVLAILPYTACAEEATVVWRGEETFQPAWEGDSQSLFAGYVRSLFYGVGKQSRSSETAGSLLTGNNAVLYNEIKPYILELADGTRSSTEITYSPAIFGVEGNYWTAEELGVAAIVSNGAITQEAANALESKFHTDFDLVLEALLRDCAYEMFWYDKTQQTIRTTFNFFAQTSGGVLRLGWEGVYTVKLPVSAEYAAGDYAIDAGKIASAKTAAANAKAIVNRYAGASDLEKLNGYRQEICDLASYNYAAAGNSGTPFGNPWQMIWVFDGDPATSVVCEGYSKAFQYLCEQTSFTGNISCILVDGWMGSGSMEGHMWNVLRMDDGKNYIADITNCDDGHAGAPDLLFLSGYADNSTEGYYVYSCNGTWIAYTYNDNTLASYPGSWLEMSSERYVEQQHPDPSPAPWENLRSLTLPAGTTEIMESAFEGAGMERVILPEGVQTIGGRAFAFCTKLRYVNLPDSLATIADDAFSGCTGLTVLCARGSAAEAYANEHGLSCAYPDE